ncbi:hypothetical protein V6Z11_D10G172800 [Gossypium hirsutum]
MPRLRAYYIKSGNINLPLYPKSTSTLSLPTSIEAASKVTSTDSPTFPFQRIRFLELIPKLDLAKKHISSQLHVNLPDIEVRQLVATAIILKGLGAILFVFGHGFGALLLFVYLLVSTPLLYDFYNYRPNEPQYSVLLGDFLQCVAQCDALIFFVGMKNSMPKRQLRRKAPKQKAT